jgi:hypothetical protein
MQLDFAVRAIGHARFLGDLGAQPQGPGRGAGSRGEPRACTHHRTCSSATPAPRRHSPGQAAPGPGPPPLSSPARSPVKPDASRSFAAGGSAGPAGRARSGPRVSPGSVGRPRAGRPCAPARDTPHRSTAGRGRTRCTTAPLAGTAHTRTSVRSAPGQALPRRQPASTPPLRAPKRLRSRCARALDESRPSVQYFARTVCSTRWGAAV